ncbi:hypothetical protein BC832DRAFT_595821 [Gaertneriomyces semiglobifer]|nr:hypothetical protein BC832DRAFT_595821 [Gaertneriomyces semiglobifer]
MQHSILREISTAIRSKEIAHRIFWSKSSNIPTYVRGKSDAMIFGVAAVALTIGLGLAAQDAKGLVNGTKKEFD